MDWDSVHFTYLKNLYWVAVVATRCIVTALGYSFQSTSLRVKFLEALIKCNFSADLPGKKIMSLILNFTITRVIYKNLLIYTIFQLQYRIFNVCWI